MAVHSPTPVTCPSADELRKLLRGKLADTKLADLTGHLDECSNCQSKIELIAEGDADISGAVKHIDQDEPPRESAYWKALEGIDASVTSTFAVPDAKPNNSKLDFLKPSTDPDKIGRLGHFEVIRELGRGGMGIVLQAHDSDLSRDVALKVLDPQLASNDIARSRFCREARAAAAVSHENIVTIYSVDEDEASGLPFLVMQVVVGETLEQRIRREGKIAVDDLMMIAYQAAQGLTAAHAAGLIHRDIKPGNILIDSNTNKAKLTDFGLARSTEDMSLTRTGFVAGTPLYMAPEQARGDDVDARADLFSLGSVMYEALSGRPPFDGNTPMAVLRRVADEAHPRLTRLNATVPLWLEDIIDELLEKDPNRRTASAEMLSKQLAAHMSPEACASTATPIECTVARTASRIAGSRRRSKLTTALVLGLPFLAGGLVGALIGMTFVPPEQVVREVPTVVQENNLLLPTSAVAPLGPESLAVINAETGGVWSVAAAKDGNTIVAGLEDGSFGMWTLEPPGRVLSMPNAHDAPIWAVDISADAKTVITASDDGTVKIWDVSGAGVVKQTMKHPTSVRSAALDPSGLRVVTGDRAGTVRVWTIGDDEETQSFKHGGTISAVTFDPLGMSVVSTSTNTTAKLWELPTGKARVSFSKHKGPVYGVSFSPDGAWVATASWDKTVMIWDARTGDLVREIPAHDECVLSVAFACCGKVLATAGQDGTVKVWNAETGTLLNRFMRHKGTVHSVTFLPEKHQLLSGGRDGFIRLWQTK